MQHLDDLFDNKLYQYEMASDEFNDVQTKLKPLWDKLTEADGQDIHPLERLTASERDTLNKLQERFQVLHKRIAELELELGY